MYSGINQVLLGQLTIYFSVHILGSSRESGEDCVHGVELVLCYLTAQLVYTWLVAGIL